MPGGVLCHARAWGGYWTSLCKGRAQAPCPSEPVPCAPMGCASSPENPESTVCHVLVGTRHPLRWVPLPLGWEG